MTWLPNLMATEVDKLLSLAKQLTRDGNVTDGLKNAEQAVRLSGGAAEAQLRRAICLFRLGRHGEAKWLAQYFSKGQEADTWRALLSKQSQPVTRVPVIPSLDSQSTKPPTESLPETRSKTPEVSQTLAAPRIDWYQSQSSVTVVVYRKDLDPTTTNIEILPQQLKVTSPGFEWETPLSEVVNTTQSSYDLTKFKIEFQLAKHVPHTWTSLTSPSTSEPVAERVETTNLFTADPKKPVITSYKKWESLDDSGEEDTGSGDPMQFFQNLYRDAPPDVRRAMMKSYTESNGTALSTNWEDVKKRKVETQPPQSMEAKDWK